MADSVFKTVLRHYLFEVGLSIMFDNIERNMTLSVPNKYGFHRMHQFPFDCDILLKIPTNEDAEWIDDLVCIGCDGTTYFFETCKFPCDWVIKISVNDESEQTYLNPSYREVYTDIDGILKYCDDDTEVDLNEFDIIGKQED